MINRSLSKVVRGPAALAKFARGTAGVFFEGGIKRSFRIETGFERDVEDTQMIEFTTGKHSFTIFRPVSVDEIVKVLIECGVDQVGCLIGIQ